MEDYPTIDQRSGSKSTITAFFDDRQSAERAIGRLRSTNIPDECIRLTEGSHPGANPDDRGIEGLGFFERLGAFFFPDDDRSAYAEGLSRGGYLVTATPLSPDLYDAALDILDDDGAVDIEERSATWRAEGWTGSYTDLHYRGGLIRAQQDQAALPGGPEPVGTDQARRGSYDTERLANHSDESSGEDERRRGKSPAAAGMAAAVSGVLLGTDARSEGLKSTTDGETQEVIEERRHGKRDTTHGRTRVRSYVLDEEDADTDGERPVDPPTESGINRR